MFPKHLPSLLPVLLIATTACSSGGGGGGGGGNTEPDATVFPVALADEFQSLASARWRVELDEGVASPRAENGLLWFRWDGADLGSRARLALKRTGYYEAAALDVPLLDPSVETRITIGLAASGQARFASIGLRGGTERVVEAAIEDDRGAAIERESTRLSRLDVPDGALDERIRLEVDVETDTVRFYFANELILSYTEPLLSLPDWSEVTIEVEARDTQATAIERFEAALLSEIPERRLTDVRPNHAPPSRVQWLFKLRDAEGEVLSLDPAQADTIVARPFESGIAIDQSETCPVIRTFSALPLRIAIVLDHTLSMETFGGIDAMKESAKALLDVLSDSHVFSIWEFHDNRDEGGFSQLLPAGATRERGKEVIDAYDPDLRGFSLCWDTIQEALEKDFPEEGAVSELRVVVFFSDGVDTSSSADPDDLVGEALGRGALFYSLGYGRLTPDSRANLLELSQRTNGLFFEAPTPEEILPEFQRLIDELSGFLQLAYVTGRFLDRRVDSLTGLDFEGRPVQQYIRGAFDGRDIAFDDGDNRYDAQAGILEAGPALVVETEEEGPVLEVPLRAFHVPRQTTAFELSVQMLVEEGGVSIEVPLGEELEVRTEPNGPFDEWPPAERVGQTFRFEGPEACFGDFGPLLRLRIPRADLPEAFRLVLRVDNGIYDDLLRFGAGPGLESDILPADDFVAVVPVGP